MRTSLRPVDLARMAGVSTQQIRNYEDAGVLPPVPRTPSGYRSYTPRHGDALLAYRALIRGYGPYAAQEIMRAVHAGDLPLALAMLDAGHAALHEQRLALQETSQALEALAGQPPDTTALPRTGVRIGDVAGYLGVRPSALRVWESAGLLTPDREPGTGYRHFTPADVRDARLINMLRQSHYPLPRIRPILDRLRRTGSTDALHAAITERRTALTKQATAMLEASSHLHHYLTEHPAAET